VVEPPSSLSAAPARASRDELAPLFELCRAGKLFEVQEWIAAGRPVNPPPERPKRHKFTSPLLVAIDKGFHSLVKVLLEGGALQEPNDNDSPMNRVLEMRRRDMVELLVENGFDPKKVDLSSVLHSWDPGLMEYFLERGADPVAGLPFAHAFCHRVRTVVKVYKKYREQVPELQEQANIALPYHCTKGNMRWVQLMLWAGADPYAKGAVSCYEDTDGYDGSSALIIAAIHDHFDVFRIKKIRTSPDHPGLRDCIYFLSDGEGFDILTDLLKRGLNPNDEERGGCSAIHSWLSGLDFQLDRWGWDARPKRGKIDSDYARQRLRAIHLVARHGGRWAPSEDGIKSVRRTLLKMIPDYTVEFIWIMSKYKAARQEDLTTLLNSPSMRNHIASYRPRLDELLLSFSGDARSQLSDQGR
jgi:hypothetical protein